MTEHLPFSTYDLQLTTCNLRLTTYALILTTCYLLLATYYLLLSTCCPGVWAVFVAHIAFNFGAYYMTNWNPTYYTDVLKVSPADAKWHLAMPHLSNLLAKVVSCKV